MRFGGIIVGVIVSKYLISIMAGAAFIVTGGVASAEEGDYRGNFEGFYAGLLTGFAPASNNNRYHVGVFGGYRWSPYNNFVVGVEGQATFGLDTFSGRYVVGTISGQLGMIVGDNILLYTKAGFASETYIAGPWTTYVPKLGAGVEMAVNDQINLRFEAVAGFNYPANSFYAIHGAEFNFGVVVNLD